MPKRGHEDLTDQKFNRYTFIRFDSKDSNGRQRWLCKCDCGVEKVVDAYSVKSGHTKSCGCLRLEYDDLIGEKFTRLLVKFLSERIAKSGDKYWECICDCGNTVTVLGKSLKYGNTRSCGCLNLEYEDFIEQRFGKLIAKKHLKESNWLCVCDCGNETIVKSGSLKSGDSRSCSCLKTGYDDLVGVRFKLLLVERVSHRNNKSKTYWKCLCDCGNYVIVREDCLKDGNTQSCGCFLKATTKARMSGKNNHNYRHDLTKEERKDLENNRKLCPKHAKWRKKVFIRDNYTCKCCGQRGVELHAHHIYSYHLHKKLRYVTSNGVTLCKNCHKKFHKIYTNKNNTKKQFTEFIKNHGKDKTS